MTEPPVRKRLHHRIVKRGRPVWEQDERAACALEAHPSQRQGLGIAKQQLPRRLSWDICNLGTSQPLH